MKNKVRYNVEKFYYDNHRVYTNEDGGQYEEEVLNIYQKGGSLRWITIKFKRVGL